MSARPELAPGVVAAEHTTRLDNGAIRCELCPRRCVLYEGQQGYCAIRAVDQGRLVLSAYGRTSGLAVDPIEKKPLFHFYPGSRVLSFGAIGCNLGCSFCQNAHLSRARDPSRLALGGSPGEIVRAARVAGVTAVAFTYNEPVISYEHVTDTARACREQGIETVVVSAGYISAQAREGFFAPMSAANIDLKSINPAFYKKHCQAELKPVKDTLVYLRHHTRVWLEVTTLLIPGENDSEAEVEALCDWFVAALGPKVPLHFSAFHPSFRLTALPPTPAATLVRARAQALRAGLRFVYIGNVRSREGTETLCPACGHVVIARAGYALVGSELEGGACRRCGAVVPGVFSRAGSAPSVPGV